MSQDSSILQGRSIITRKCPATGKTRYRTEADARISIVDLKWIHHQLRKQTVIRHRSGKPAQQRSYFCTHCAGYHLTSWNFISAKAQKEKKAKHRFVVEYLLGLIRSHHP